MAHIGDTQLDQLPFSWHKEIDSICTRFERAWQEQPVELEAFWTQREGDKGTILFRELVKVEWVCRRQSGPLPTKEEYLARFPEHAEWITTAWEQSCTVDVADPPAGKDGEEWRKLLRPPEREDELGRLGCYRICRIIGCGGMGIVFEAEDEQLQRKTALKIMRPRVTTTSARDRFLREARAMAAIEHDHIVTIYQVGEENGVPFLAMPLLRGQSLADRLQTGKPLTVQSILRLGRETAQGLAAAHRCGLIHRDIKPANIWLEQNPDSSDPDDSWKVKILDFGLALGIEDASHLTESGIVIGTPSYMAPEQAQAEHVDGRADLFSLGCILYQMVTGKIAFQGKNALSTVLSVVSDTPTPVAEINPSLPEEIIGLIDSLMAKSPKDRPSSAREVAKQLGRMEKRQLVEFATSPK